MHKKRSHLTYLTFIKYLSIIFYDKVAGKIFDVNCAIINTRMGGADRSGSPTPPPGNGASPVPFNWFRKLA